MIDYEDLDDDFEEDDDTPPKTRKQGTLNDLHKYEENRSNGAKRRYKEFKRKGHYGEE